MKNLYAIALAAFILSLTIEDASAQRWSEKKKYWAVGGSLCFTNYFGDITPRESFTSVDIGFTRYQFGASVMRRFHPKMFWRAQVNYLRLQGSDKESADPADQAASFRYLRNLNFRNDIVEVSGSIIYDLFENRGSFLKRVDYTPYVFIGLGGIHHNPQGEFDGSWINLKDYNTEDTDYSRFQVIIPAGIGIRYKLSNKLDLAFEIGYRYAFTDYLDDVSGNFRTDYTEEEFYVANRTLESYVSDPVARDIVDEELGYVIRTRTLENGTPVSYIQGYDPGRPRGDSSDNDWYVVSGFHLTYILAPGVVCPKFR